ncbi:MAG: putative transposase [Gammaproteobacteria bacterium]|jgi:putative transposase
MLKNFFVQRGITVPYETVRRRCLKFRPEHARRLRRHCPIQGERWYLDEVFVSIGGLRCYLWRAVDQDRDVIDMVLRKRRNGVAAKRFLHKLLKGQQAVPNGMVTDKIRSYRVANRELIPTVPHDTSPYPNNLCEASHRAARKKQHPMKQFPTVSTTQRFLCLDSLVRNFVNWRRHAINAATYRHLRTNSFNA